MRWFKRDKWKTSIAIASVLLLLVFMVWVPVSAVGAQERASGLAKPVTGTVQATPTEDATVTALNKEKLAREVEQLKEQNAPDLLGWLRTNAAVLLSTLVVVIGGLIGLFRWLGDRRDEQEKRREEQRSEQEKRAEEQKRWLEDRQAERERRDQEQQRWLKDQEAEREKQLEERFQSVVEGLGSSSLATQNGSAITLRTFLRPGYEQFYTQTFDLAVASLGLPRTSPPSEDPDGIPHSPEDPNAPLPLTTLSQALIVVFKEAFPRAREELKKQLSEQKAEFNSQLLDASRIQLDNAYLSSVDLQKIWMPESILRRANLNQANLNQANLNQANLTEANLQQTNLSEATLIGATLIGAKLDRATLSQTDFRRAVLDGAKLSIMALEI